MIYLVELLVALGFLLMNAVFVLVEFAIVKVRFTRIEELAQKGNINAKISLEILKNINSYLASIQLGITMASLGLGWIGEPAFAKLMEPLFREMDIPFIKAYSYSISFGFAFAIISALHIIAGEQVPKYIAISTSEKIALFFAIPLKIFYKLTYYPMLLINGSANAIVKLFKLKNNEHDTSHSEDELRIILGQTEELGKISLGRLMMFEHLFDFGKTTVQEVMTTQKNIISISIGTEVPGILSVIKEKKHSRYPVTDNTGKYIGFIHIKDLIINLSNCLDLNKIDLKPSLREIKTVEHNITLEKALKIFQENRIQIALVKKKGASHKEEIAGLLTLEDIIEELTGEIRDEFETLPDFRLNDILLKESSLMDLKSIDRYGAIQEMINKLFETNMLIDKDVLVQKIIEREKVFSTALGHQVAFPHARIENLKRPILIIGKSSKGVNFPSPDNVPVKIIFMILTPFNDPTIQLKILAKLSKVVSNLTLRKRLFSAKNIETICNVFSTFENKIPEEQIKF